MDVSLSDDSERLVLVGEVYGIYLQENGEVLMGILPDFHDYFDPDQVAELNLWLAFHVGIAFPTSRTQGITVVERLS
jgi:hypothetical protein